MKAVILPVGPEERKGRCVPQTPAHEEGVWPVSVYSTQAEKEENGIPLGLLQGSTEDPQKQAEPETRAAELTR